MDQSPSHFQSMSDLTSYLKRLEERVINLETENTHLKEELNTMTGDNLSLAQYVQKNVPKTTLFSPNFIARAFAVWGHYFVAQLLIGLGFFALYFLVVVALMLVGSLAGAH